MNFQRLDAETQTLELETRPANRDRLEQLVGLALWMVLLVTLICLGA